MKTLRDIECDYLESLLPMEACQYLMENYKKEIFETRDYFYKLKDYEINIYDLGEGADHTEWAGICYAVDSFGDTDWDDEIYRHYFDEEELV